MSMTTFDLKPMVISTPRSGLNFIRLCVESLGNVRTPGRTLLIDATAQAEAVFDRTHDGAGLRSRETGHWLPVDEDARRLVMVLIRDPLEIFGRGAKMHRTTGHALRELELYASNLNRFCALPEASRGAFYYEDYTVSPAGMAEAVAFLRVVPMSQAEMAEALEKDWERLRTLGRELYDKNQAEAGGSMTKADPNNLKHHQESLDDEAVALAKSALSRTLGSPAKALIARYGLALT